MNTPNDSAATSTSPSPWVVLKFGGTSVSSVNNWKNIANIVKARLAEGLQPVVVHSAVSRITDSLEQLLARALTGGWESALDAIINRHRDLARDLGITPSPELEEQFTACDRLLPASHWLEKSVNACARGSWRRAN
jgi:diaminopimelate decarboxylase/aspartate kinase